LTSTIYQNITGLCVEFFFGYFPYGKAEALIAWYRGFRRMRLKIELLD
jgi:hypothetical protein